MKKTITVVAAIIFNEDQTKILATHRHNHVNQGGLWEFPGGKVETGESDFDALRRELQEELDIDIEMAEPFMELAHTTYPQYDVYLKTFIVKEFHGQPKPNFAQDMRWIPVNKLTDYPFPEANEVIIKKLNSV